MALGVAALFSEGPNSMFERLSLRVFSEPLRKLGAVRGGGVVG
jgi:hypothetical protein